MKLYDYYRSTACYRVRIALEYKGIPYERIPVHLIDNGGEQHDPNYLALNPQGLVPSLEVNGNILTQSLAIMEYLDELYPEKPLLPKNPVARAEVRSLALLIACEIHPLNNLRVRQQLAHDFNASETQTTEWSNHWLTLGFDAFEQRLQSLHRTRDVCYGDHVTFADLCLIPQVYNAKRFHFSLDAYPLIQQINQHCLTLTCFTKAAPIA